MDTNANITENELAQRQIQIQNQNQNQNQNENLNENENQNENQEETSNDNFKEFNKYWITPLETSIVEACNLFKLNYLKSTIEEIGSNLKKAIAKKGINVIEVSFNNKNDMSFVKKMSNKIN